MKLIRLLVVPILLAATLVIGTPSSAATGSQPPAVAVVTLPKPHVHHHHAHVYPYGITPSMMQPVLAVHHCEQPSSWHITWGSFPGGLGMTQANWDQFRAPSFPANMGLATPYQQAWALYHFIAHYGIAWPDQPFGHCTVGGY